MLCLPVTLIDGSIWQFKELRVLNRLPARRSILYFKYGGPYIASAYAGGF